jgi:metallo-beta-lactamase family protein
MHIRFFGATGDTTGSCHLIETERARVLLECGLFQGRREETYRRNLGFGFPVGRVDAVVQSHAHIDHSGKLPMLARCGYSGPIHSTPGTRDLAEILLLDSASIQLADAEYLNRQRLRRDLRQGTKRERAWRRRADQPECLGPASLPETELRPLYLDEDVLDTLPLFRSHAYREWFDVAEGVRARFHDAGHILGSAWIELELSEAGRTVRLAFTGDYGRPGQPILRDPEPLLEADVFISESTYGARSHPPYSNMERDLGDAVERLARRGRGRLLVPVFAVGRAQNILYTLAKVFRTRNVGEVQIAVDSPLATKATRVVLAHRECFDEEALDEFVRLSSERSFASRLRFTESVDESKSLNRDPRPTVVLSASGMMESGRILHHLAFHLSSPDCEVLVVGYQASATLGRRLVQGAREVSVLGTRYQVRAQITPMLGFSAHADREGLLAALTPHARSARTLFLIHGEDDQRLPLARELSERGFARVECPTDSSAFAL